MLKKRKQAMERRWPLIKLVLILFFPIVAYGDDKWPIAWEFWDTSDSTSDRHLSHDSWNEFLGTYVTETDDGINRVNYDGVTEESRNALKSYIDRMSALDPRDLNKAEQFAYWINLYNALTVEVVLQHPGAKSIRQMGGGLFRTGPWRDKLVGIAGQVLSLDDIEHRILRPIFRDRRIHYAVNCASISCPNLGLNAYTGEDVEIMLCEAEANYINHGRAVSFDNNGRLVLSSIFKWYASDFAPDEESLLAYLAEHHKSYRERLTNYTSAVRYEYDWSPNSIDAR